MVLVARGVEHQGLNYAASWDVIQVPELPCGNGARVIEVNKLDGSTMHLNEDLVERVESGVEGQSAVYLRDGAHFIVANVPETVVAMIRAEKTELLRRAFLGDDPDATAPNPTSHARLTSISQVRGQ